MYQGKYGGWIWHEGYLDRDDRTALNIFNDGPIVRCPKAETAFH